MTNQSEDDTVYLEWLAAAPKGVRWDKAQEMYALYQERRRQQAETVAKRLLGKSKKSRCPECNDSGGDWCEYCCGTGEVDGN